MQHHVQLTAWKETMAATASGRQAWRQLMRKSSSRGPSSLLRQFQQDQFALRRYASSASTRTSSRRVITQSPSTFLRQQPLVQRSYSSGSQGGQTPPRSNNNQIKFWPFVIVIALGSGGYMLLVNRRKGELAYTPKKDVVGRRSGWHETPWARRVVSPAQRQTPRQISQASCPPLLSSYQPTLTQGYTS